MIQHPEVGVRSGVVAVPGRQAICGQVREYDQSVKLVKPVRLVKWRCCSTGAAGYLWAGKTVETVNGSYVLM